MNLLDRARREGTPLIDGNKVTFVWEGDDPPLLAGDWTNWNEREAVRLEQVSKGVYAHTAEFPSDTYLEYAYFRRFRTNDADPDDKEIRLADPFNSNTIWNGVDADNHLLRMPDFKPTPLLRPKRGIKRGKVVKHKLSVQGSNRPIWTYQPPVDDPVPLVVVWDGRDFVNRAKLPVIVDNLIALGKIQPFAMVMPENAGKHRFLEYHSSESTLMALTYGLLPFAQQHLNLIDVEKNPGAYGVLGASMGGLMALYTGLRLPHIFGKVVSHSGAYDFFYAGRRQMIYDLIEYAPKENIRIWQDCGRFEWLLPGNRAMNALLVKRGYDVTYHEFNGGHNYTMWANVLPQALQTIFGQ